MTHLRVDAADWPNLERLLDAVLDLPPEARQPWLDSLPESQAGLRDALRAMLLQATAVQANNFLAYLPPVTLHTTPASRAGEIVGPWRLIRELGAGGMASVWLAERADGLVHRPVALKLPHNIAHWRGLAERMAREREILAALTHPNIARLYDAGITSDNIPWLAIEYVEGMSIDAYCRAARDGAPLPIRERLRLFAQVGEAVAYAHGKLIVHRDLKPANILVTHDAQVRLLDFGIATLLEGEAARESPLTEITGRALTLDYAAPEQIAGVEYTTSADVYSLGVILFELLTGRRPYLRESESRQAFEHTLLTSSAPRASEVAVEHHRELRGDLDLILQKALKKDPRERYATVAALVDDVQRHLDGRPVLAQPDSARYRAAKFVRRHKIGVASAASIVLAIVVGAAMTAWQARVAVAERQRTEEINQFITSIFRQADPFAARQTAPTARELLHQAREDLKDRFDAHPDIGIELMIIVGSSLLSVGDLAAAEQTLSEALPRAERHLGANSVTALRCRVLLAETHNARRDADRLTTDLAALEPVVRQHGESHPDLLVSVLKMKSDLAIERGQFDAMREPAREALALARARLGTGHALTNTVHALFAETFVIWSDSDEEMLAETRRALDETLAAHANSPNHPQVLRMRNIYGRALAIAGRIRESVIELRTALEATIELFGADSAQAADLHGALAPYARRIGAVSEALEHSEKFVAALAGRIERDSADFAVALTTRGVTQIAARNAAAAERDLAQAEAIYSKLFGVWHWDTLTVRLNRGVALAYQGRFEPAREAFNVTQDPRFAAPFPWWVAHVRGIVQRLEGDAAAAVASQRDAERLIPEGPRADWERARVMPELGLSLLAAGRRLEAQRELERSVATFQMLGIEMHPAYAETLAGLERARRAGRT